ncbi:YSIRK-type signal peptide-containing protein [Streptococcus macedonicus]|nr:YSIRK-type signal peptide-containing protein [Streptococcus macedonicus]MCW8486673.1 YSIRK-type signal peptide-containing protein [Streptococcus macedonicus]MCW8494860.1 YSIRK-type signal peptide-containing protein [Streptococcus macedonicus]MCW8502348.1 YSIRK-type signal peptide-containing protein [Streptococcus macedonicus]MCW8647207.1 YSIRK-type signal peptide-containing protein [Streptococcus macedonicus]MCW8651393.1 YSIRK-type signal peptide-containing protein [Streptococcus macedonicu
MKKSMFGREEQRFGIRKYSVGVASVLIASVLVMGGGQTVSADDVVSADTISTELVTDVQEESENLSAISESNVQADVTTEDEKTEAVTSDEADEQAVSQVANENQPEETADVAKEEQVEGSNATETSEARKVESNENKIININVAQASKNVQTNQACVFEESKIPITANSLPNQGYYTYTKQMEVKNTPEATAPVAFYANAGDRIFTTKF